MISIVAGFPWLFGARSTKLVQIEPVDAAPGGMRLLAGYRHIRTKGFDTRTGRIWREEGPETVYDIGPLALNEARVNKERGNVNWFKTQMASGSLVEIAKKPDGSLIATFGNYANFVTRGIKTDEDLVDTLLMLMTFNTVEAMNEVQR